MKRTSHRNVSRTFPNKRTCEGERCWRERRERSVNGKGRGIKPVTRGHLRWCFVWESVALKRHGGYDECVKVTWGLCWVVHVAHWGWVVPCIVSQAGTLSQTASPANFCFAASRSHVNWDAFKICNEMLEKGNNNYGSARIIKFVFFNIFNNQQSYD